MTSKKTHRYITKSDRLVVYRHPVAREHADETLNTIRENWWRIEKEYKNNRSRAGIMMYNMLKFLFGNEEEQIILTDDESDDIYVDYEEKDCLDWWDLNDTQEL